VASGPQNSWTLRVKSLAHFVSVVFVPVVKSTLKDRRYSQSRARLAEISRFIIVQPYICCGGMFDCCCLKDPCSDSCLIPEVCCCFTCSLVANRFLMQTRFNLRNTDCDNCILTFTAAMACLVSILRCICTSSPCKVLNRCSGAKVSSQVQSLVDLLVCSVEGCMLTQQDIELKKIIRNGLYRGTQQQVILILPPGVQPHVRFLNFCYKGKLN
jgi:hypothetical protein